MSPLSASSTRRVVGVCSLLGAVALLSGCTQYHYVVRSEGAPIYADAEGTQVIGQMEQYHHEPIASAPSESGTVEIQYNGQTGYVRPDDVRVFSYESRDRRRRDRAVRENIREVVLESSSWSDAYEEAIRQNKILKGMTREQVELAWGLPRTIVPGKGGGERWIFQMIRLEDCGDVYVGYGGGFGGIGSHFVYRRKGCGGYKYNFPIYTSYVKTRSVEVRVRREVFFDAQGRVEGWTTNEPPTRRVEQ